VQSRSDHTLCYVSINYWPSGFWSSFSGENRTLNASLKIPTSIRETMRRLRLTANNIVLALHKSRPCWTWSLQSIICMMRRHQLHGSARCAPHAKHTEELEAPLLVVLGQSAAMNAPRMLGQVRSVSRAVSMDLCDRQRAVRHTQPVLSFEMIETRRDARRCILAGREYLQAL
jgi:hypothetical protein